MDTNEDRELEESLSFMRQKFQSLSQHIKIPDSLKADVLRKRLELMELEQESVPQPRSKVLKFPWRPVAGTAACFVLVVGSFLAFQGNNKVPSIEQLTGDVAMSAAMAPADPTPGASAGAMADAPAGAPAPAAFAAPALGVDAANTTTEEDSAAAVEIAEEESKQVSALDGVPGPMMARGAPVPESDASSQAGEYSMLIGMGETLDTQEKAHAIEKFGGYLPKSGLGDLTYSSGLWLDGQLSAVYLNADYSRELRVVAFDYTDAVKNRLVNVGQPETYDMRLYTMPYADSVSATLYDVFFSPIFRRVDLTKSVTEARILLVEGSGDKRYTGNFSVLYDGGIVVDYSVNGLTANELYTIATALK